MIFIDSEKIDILLDELDNLGERLTDLEIDFDRMAHDLFLLAYDDKNEHDEIFDRLK